MESIEHGEQLVLIHDPDRCTGCMTCMMACAYKHYHTLDLDKAFRLILEMNEGFFVASYCVHCDYPACVAACPTGAMHKDERSGWVLNNPLLCIGCGNCVYACPVSNPRIDPFLKISVKCDFCGGDPWCAKFCPSGATRVVTREEARDFFKKVLPKLGVRL
ncbi:MAG: 4Fe-4S dicluster domain-containing protein [Thermoprotei archaeon]|nr:4Fe-4S dicluster domain-containing protein [Thermoprotei archaeon]